ncbi:MAG TPA: response regulator [Syntrophorhabdales bacterium]|nr:response regulator [Syntrophorhabdales bacterium]
MAHERILIVEDDVITATEIRQTLQQLGYEPIGPVASGKDAVANGLTLRPDVVLMDIVLKGPMDGIEAAEVIRSKDLCPVIFVTAHSDQSTLDRAKVTAPFGYVLKPITERELHTAIEIALYRHRMEEQLRESREWFRTALRNIDEAIIALDIRGVVSFLNPAAETLLGWPETEALGRAGLEVFNVIREEAPGAGGLPEKGDRQVFIRIRDGKTVSMVYRTAPIVNGTEEVRGMVLIFREPTRDQPNEAEHALHIFG